MKKVYFYFLLGILFVLSTQVVFSQWSPDPAINLAVGDTTGEQALAKIGSTSDGGCYISWFDNRSGSYAVYLQRLDPLGNKMWAPNGLLVSNNSQSSSLVDWDLLVDDNDNAIIALQIHETAVILIHLYTQFLQAEIFSGVQMESI